MIRVTGTIQNYGDGQGIMLPKNVLEAASFTENETV